MSPVVRECQRLGMDFFILHTGQHYSYNMDRVFFEQLSLPEAEYNLDVGSGSHAEQTGRMLMGIEKVLIEEDPDVVLVEGDTNTVLAGALTSNKLGIKVGHVEAGLRSYDRCMPEETNRVLTDHCSDFLFAPTERSKWNLLYEGIPDERIFVTGNTIVDVIFYNIEISKVKSNILEELGLIAGGYFLTTIHRQENVDNPNKFKGILKGLEMVHMIFNLPVVYPIHPRARKQMNIFGYEPEGVKLVEPIDYLSFLQLESNAKLVLTDSGGIQEEACILVVPCVTLRNNTERPETLDVGSNLLAGTDPVEIVKKTEQMLKIVRDWRNPFGDGKAGKKIVQIIRDKVI